MEPDSTESWTDGRWRSQSEAEAAPATGTPAVRLELASAADSRLQQRLWALAVCGLGPNLGDNGVRYRSEEQLDVTFLQIEHGDQRSCRLSAGSGDPADRAERARDEGDP